LITIGQNVVSKRVKQFLRKAKPKQHWHIDEYWQPDTYFVLSQKIETKPEVFFSKLLKSINLEPRAYFNLWDVLKDKKDAKHEEYLNKAPFSDFYLFNQLSNQVPENYRFISPILRQSDMHNYLNIRNMMCIATEEPAVLTVVLLRQWDLQ
jgi:2-succinyl-5-enolpyruvyl-6-hydroxy-3-cyclohexene-1-carboxylate synthase